MSWAGVSLSDVQLEVVAKRVAKQLLASKNDESLLLDGPRDWISGNYFAQASSAYLHQHLLDGPRDWISGEQHSLKKSLGLQLTNAVKLYMANLLNWLVFFRLLKDSDDKYIVIVDRYIQLKSKKAKAPPPLYAPPPYINLWTDAFLVCQHLLFSSYKWCLSTCICIMTGLLHPKLVNIWRTVQVQHGCNP